jgi:cell division protein FtsB
MSASWIRSPGRGFSALVGEAISNALCSLIICYSVVSFFAGQVGLLAYKDLGGTIVKMEAKISQLQEDNGKLLASKEALAGSVDRQTREARGIGFVRPGEKIVLMPSELHSVSLPAGSVDEEPIRVGLSTGLPDAFVKFLSAMIAAGVFCASLVMAASPGRRRGVGIRSGGPLQARADRS